MGLIVCEWLTAEVKAFAKSGKGLRRRCGGDFLKQNRFKTLNNEGFEGCSPPGRGKFLSVLQCFQANPSLFSSNNKYANTIISQSLHGRTIAEIAEIERWLGHLAVDDPFGQASGDTGGVKTAFGAKAVEHPIATGERSDEGFATS